MNILCVTSLSSSSSQVADREGILSERRSIESQSVKQRAAASRTNLEGAQIPYNHNHNLPVRRPRPQTSAIIRRRVHAHEVRTKGRSTEEWRVLWQWHPLNPRMRSRGLRILQHQMDRRAQIPCLQTSRLATHPFEGSSMICTWLQDIIYILTMT